MANITSVIPREPSSHPFTPPGTSPALQSPRHLPGLPGLPGNVDTMIDGLEVTELTVDKPRSPVKLDLNRPAPGPFSAPHNKLTAWAQGAEDLKIPQCNIQNGQYGPEEVTAKPFALGNSLFHFADADEIKRQVRESIMKKEAYDVSQFYHERGLFQYIARHHVFENMTLGVICMNALYIAIDTDWNDASGLLDAHWVFQTCEHAFCLYFSLEWFVRFMAFRRKKDCVKDGWFVFDSVLVFMMVAETWVLTFFTVFSGGDGSSPFGDNASILRLARLLRLSRLMKMLKSLPELMILIKGMFTAVKSVCYVLALLLMITYVFAIAFTQIAKDTEMGEIYFEHVSLSMYSLVIYATFLDNLADFCNDVRAESSVGMFMVMCFVCISSLCVLNMLIGVLCEVISAVAAIEKEELLTTMVYEKMEFMMSQLDNDFDGMISIDEFKQILRKPEAASVLQQVGVCPESLVDFADMFFMQDGKNIKITFPKFMDMVLDLRGTNTATVKDIMNLWKQIDIHVKESQYEIQKKIDGLQDQVTKVQDSTAQIEKKLDKVLDVLSSGSTGIARGISGR